MDSTQEMHEILIEPYHVRLITANAYALKIGAKHTLFMPKSVLIRFESNNRIYIKKWWYDKNINDLKEFKR